MRCRCARALAGGCARSAADLYHSLGINHLLVSAGVALIILGLLWSRIKRLPLFHLPGDIVIDRPGFRFFFPITTMLLISAVISCLAWALRK